MGFWGGTAVRNHLSNALLKAIAEKCGDQAGQGKSCPNKEGAHVVSIPPRHPHLGQNLAESLSQLLRAPKCLSQGGKIIPVSHWKAGEVSQKTSFCCRMEGWLSCPTESDVEETAQESGELNDVFFTLTSAISS